MRTNKAMSALVLRGKFAAHDAEPDQDDGTQDQEHEQDDEPPSQEAAPAHAPSVPAQDGHAQWSDAARGEGERRSDLIKRLVNDQLILLGLVREMSVRVDRLSTVPDTLARIERTLERAQGATQQTAAPTKKRAPRVEAGQEDMNVDRWPGA